VTAHVSVAMAEVQGRRSRTIVPQGRPLHDCVNLYVPGQDGLGFTHDPGRGGFSFAEFCDEVETLIGRKVGCRDREEPASPRSGQNPRPGPASLMAKERFRGALEGHRRHA